MEIDPIIDAALGFSSNEIDPIFLESEVPDVYAEVLAAAQLDKAIGIAGFANSLHKEAAQFHEAADKLLKRDRSKPPVPASVDRSEPLTDDRLEKAFLNHSQRKRDGYRYWISEQLALGKSTKELSDYARRLNPEVADLIDEIGAEIEAEAA